MKQYFRTLDQQIELLRERGLVIDDEARAKDKLFMYNFYKIVNGTRDFFTISDDNYKYREGVRFEYLVDLHVFDKNLKKILLEGILDIERHLRSIISYIFMKNHSEAKAYLNPDNFNKNSSLISANTYSLEKTIENQKEERNYNKSIAYYIKKYNHVPFWFLVNFISFGKLVNFYQTMKEEEQREVADQFTRFLYDNIPEANDYYITPYQFETFITNIKEVRNVVAHDNLILNYHCDDDVAMIDPIHDLYRISKGQDRSDVFNVYLVMQVFLTKSQYRCITYSIQEAINKLREEIDDISFDKVMKSLGFPKDF